MYGETTMILFDFVELLWPPFKHVSPGFRNSQDIVNFLKVVLLWATSQTDPTLIDFFKIAQSTTLLFKTMSPDSKLVIL